jgi:5-methylcytosine-specific restriction protein A
MTRNPDWNRDEIILALDLYFNKDRGSIDKKNPKIIELSALLNKLPIFEHKPNVEKFRNVNGVTLKLSNFKAVDPTYKGKGSSHGSKLDKIVFDEYSKDIALLRKLANEIKIIVNNKNLIEKIERIGDDENAYIDEVKEGQILYKLHKVRERDVKIIKSKKDKFIKENGKLFCELCNFDFEEKYGEVGKGFIECHHIKPLHEFENEKTTKLDDLILVCSNCHRMLHRGMK